MKIWEFQAALDKGYENYQLLNSKEDFKYFDGTMDLKTSLKNNWDDNIKIKHIDEGKKVDIIKFWGPSNVLIVNRRAKMILEKLVNKNGEFLPVIDYKSNEIYYILHIINIIDAVDYSKSEFEELDPGFRIDFEKIVFIPRIIKNEDIFLVYFDDIVWINQIFVSDNFRSKILDSRLTGYEFIEIWDSDLD